MLRHTQGTQPQKLLFQPSPAELLRAWNIAKSGASLGQFMKPAVVQKFQQAVPAAAAGYDEACLRGLPRILARQRRPPAAPVLP